MSNGARRLSTSKRLKMLQNKNMKKRAKPGNIFTCQLDNGLYMFGRVLMDVKVQVFDSKILVKKEHTHLRHYDTGYVVEVYDTIAESNELPDVLHIKIPGIAVDADTFEDDVWQVIGFKAVDPKEVDFQESLNYYDGELDYHRGEIFISADVPPSLLSDEIEEFRAAAFVNSVLLYDDVYEYMQSDDPSELLDYDCRLLEKGLRETVFKIIGEDVNFSYYDLALKHGFDTARFFK